MLYRRFSYDIEGKNFDIVTVPDIVPDIIPDIVIIVYINLTCHLEHAAPTPWNPGEEYLTKPYSYVPTLYVCPVEKYSWTCASPAMLLEGEYGQYHPIQLQVSNSKGSSC